MTTRVPLNLLDGDGVTDDYLMACIGGIWQPIDPSTVVGGGGGGGGTGWTEVVNEPLNSALTGWTAGTGTWTAETDRFRLNSSGTNSAMRLFLDDKIPLAGSDVTVEIRVDASTNTTSSRAGIVWGAPATNAGGGLLAALAQTGSTTQTTRVHTEVDAVSNILDFTLPSAINHSTWMKLRAVRIGNVMDAYLDDVLIWSALLSVTSIDLRRFALVGFAVDASFRNLTINAL